MQRRMDEILASLLLEVIMLLRCRGTKDRDTVQPNSVCASPSKDVSRLDAQTKDQAHTQHTLKNLPYSLHT